MKYIHLLCLGALLALASCGTKVPDSFIEDEHLPKIYPDYTDVTIPVNIAPLSFQLEQEADEVVTRFSYGDMELVCGGVKAQPSVDDWHQLTAAAQGHDITVEVFACNGGQWKRFKPFAYHVSADSIDAYLCYRLISPSYVTYEELTLNQRCLETYDEKVMVDNLLCSTEQDGQCVNCHNFQQYNPERMLFHARQNHGGTIMVYDGKVSKVNMRNDSLLSAGVYPTWHPTLPLVVFSTNKTGQSFHTRHKNKIEVFDSASDIIAYDVRNNEVTNIENDSTEFEVFPFWAPDGKSLYYCSAHFEFRDTVSKDVEVIRRYSELHYNIYRKSFDAETMTFGPRQLVFDADTLGKSATLPRISPDGRFLVFTLGNYGCFHIWHHEADLWMLNLATGECKPMEGINSDDTESYHSWSSNGRWLVVSSRREDGNFTRPFFAHVDQQGRASKPFALPQADPDYHRQFMKSYNIPEFVSGPVEITPQHFADVLKNDEGEPVKYVRKLKNIH